MMTTVDQLRPLGTSAREQSFAGTVSAKQSLDTRK